MASGSNSRGLVLLLITSGFFITGLLFDYMPMIVDDHIKRTVELATNEEILSYWSRPPVDINSYYWLYDVVNPEQFSAGEKIQVRKVGPFHFTSRLEKRIVEVSANRYRIIYNSTRYVRLNESFFASNAPIDQPITVLNPIIGSIFEVIRLMTADYEPAQRNIAVATINKLMERYNESLLTNATAREVLLGRQMPMLDKLRRLAITFGGDAVQLPEMSAADGRVGYVALVNGSWSGPYEIYTGYQETARSIGELISYRGKRRLNYYEGQCNRLQASVGELRPMPIDPMQTLELFAPNFCRIVHIKPTGLHKLREGLAVSYALRPEDLLSAQENPDNRCYCANSTTGDHCSLNGVLELAPCSFHAPLLLAPSNMEVDPRVSSTIADFEPDLFRGEVEQVAPSDDQIQILILKRIGIPIHADLTITLLMKVIRDSRFRSTISVPEVSYVPLVTIRETVTIPARLAQIIVNLESFLALTYHIKVVMYLSAIVLLCWLTGHYYCRTTHQNDRIVPASGAARRVSTPLTAPGGGLNDGHGSGGGGASAVTGIATRIGQSIDSAGDVACQSTANQAPTFGQRDEQKQQQQQPAETDAALQSRRSKRGSQVDAAAAETASSERANSTDSNRSLPPSRHASRIGSLDAANLSFGNESRPPTGQEQQGVPADALQPTAIQQQIKSLGTRIFSRVDKELQNKQQMRRSPQINEANTAMAAPAKLPDNGAQADANAPDGSLQQAPRRRRKNWFMNVSSYFVRMLNGLRTTISDAGKLDISENDYQDKQLEMLAGKIDNWYVETPSPSAPLTDGRQSDAGERASPVVISADADDKRPQTRADMATVTERGGLSSATLKVAPDADSSQAGPMMGSSMGPASGVSEGSAHDEPLSAPLDAAKTTMPGETQGAPGQAGSEAHKELAGAVEQARRNGPLQSIEEEQHRRARAGGLAQNSSSLSQPPPPPPPDASATNAQPEQRRQPDGRQIETEDSDEEEEDDEGQEAAEASSKAHTLEQIELALSDTEPAAQVTPATKAPPLTKREAAPLDLSSEQQASDVPAINSSMSIDSVVNLAELAGQQAADERPTGASNQSGRAGLSTMTTQTTAQEADQIDESSVASDAATAREIASVPELASLSSSVPSVPLEQLQQSSEWPGQEAKSEPDTPTPPTVLTQAGNNCGVAPELQGTAVGPETGLRNGIRHDAAAEGPAIAGPQSSANEGTGAPQELQIIGQLQQASEEKGLSALAPNVTTKLAKLDGQQSISTATIRPKLFGFSGAQQRQQQPSQQQQNGDGNNILHEKVMSRTELASGAAIQQRTPSGRKLTNGVGLSVAAGSQTPAARRFEQAAGGA